MSAYETRAFCPCGWNAHAPFSSTFHIHVEVCPRCGGNKEKWVVKVVRWISHSRLFKPSTWGTGKWQEAP